MTISILAQACVRSHAPPVIITSLLCSGFGKPKPITTMPMPDWEAAEVGRRWTLAAYGMPSNTDWHPLGLSKRVHGNANQSQLHGEIAKYRNEFIYFRGDCCDPHGVTIYTDITNAEEAEAGVLRYTMQERRAYWGCDILVRDAGIVFLEVHTKFVTFVRPSEVMVELREEGGHTVYHYRQRADHCGITVAMICSFAKGHFRRIGKFTDSTRLVLTQKRIGLPSCPKDNVLLSRNKVLWNPSRLIKRDQPNLDDCWARRVRARHGGMMPRTRARRT